MRESPGYSERLFSSGRMRRWYHESRYRWVASALSEAGCRPGSVLELGCHDGRLLRYLPARPLRYLGLDADWEGGLDIARAAWAGERGVEFRYCSAPPDMRLDGETFDVAVCMDTLEHVPPAFLAPYVSALSAAARKFLLVTVPNEKGIAFPLKRLMKGVLGGASEEYSWSEFLHATLGRLDRVPRGEHKGFDYGEVARLLRGSFRDVRLRGIPLGSLPHSLNFGVGILAER